LGVGESVRGAGNEDFFMVGRKDERVDEERGGWRGSDS
jgi:hypothetical protein